jgi:para-nitrobenzyl esterase
MARTLAWLSCVAVAAIGTLASGRAQVVVKIDSGQLSGRTESGVSAYLGIPYAAPPVGAARWEAPARPAPWKGVRSAEAYGANCPQTTNEGNHLGPWTSEYLISGPTAEDCLFLNVWTPAGGARHPVLVWLHGGAFTSGSGSVVVYNGQHLARQGIVVVTINYRLGALGFLSAAALGPHSGNDGLLDMIAALQWVKRNIPAFGGDPSRVTVAGQSAGAAAVLALMASPAAKGLFARAIAESGAGVFTLGQSLQEAQHQAAEFAQAKGATNAAALRALSPDALIAPLTAPAPSAPSQHSPPAPSAPPPRITFGPVIDETVVSPEPGAGSDVPLLTGLVADEASALDPSYGQATPASLKEHSCEIPYVFGTLEAGGRPFGAADRELSRMVMRYWVNFISTGDPNGAGLPAWPVLNPQAPQVLDIDTSTRATPLLNEPKRTFFAAEIAKGVRPSVF